jgi:hypothetical protein
MYSLEPDIVLSGYGEKMSIQNLTMEALLILDGIPYLIK